MLAYYALISCADVDFDHRIFRRAHPVQSSIISLILPVVIIADEAGLGVTRGLQ
jgi:hypothetical protein